MHGVALAAGRGSRLRPLTADRPKPMLTVGDKPLLAHALDRLVDLGATQLVVVVGYCGDVIVNHFGDSYRGVPIQYAEQRTQEGMADALLAAEPYVEESFVLADGDSVVRAGPATCLDRQDDPDVDGTLLVQQVTAAEARSKALCVTTADNELVELVNKPDDPPETCRIASAFHTFPPAVFEACRDVSRSPRGEFELGAAMNLLVERGYRLVCVDADGQVFNVNTPEELAAVREALDGDPDRRDDR